MKNTQSLARRLPRSKITHYQQEEEKKKNPEQLINSILKNLSLTLIPMKTYSYASYDYESWDNRSGK